MNFSLTAECTIIELLLYRSQPNPCFLLVMLGMECPTCNKSFRTSKGYLDHYDNHTGPGQRTYPCPSCPLFYKSRRSFYRHFLTHAKQQPKSPIDRTQDHLNYAYMCTHCKCIFSHFDEFKGHVKSLKDSRPFACPICPHVQYNKFLSFMKHWRRYVPTVMWKYYVA